MSSRSPFYDDWRDCLRAHYIHVLRQNDTNNEVSLRTVLIDTGFLEWEIDGMRHDALPDLPIDQPDQLTASLESPADPIPESVTVTEIIEPMLETKPAPKTDVAPENVQSPVPPPKKEPKPKVEYIQKSMF